MSAPMYLCDPCWELSQDASGYDPMFPTAECEPFCNLSLDHDGLCAERPGKRPQVFACTNCGTEDRLHEVSPEDVGPGGREALALVVGGDHGDH